MPDNLAPTTTPPPDPAELVDREAIAEADRVRNATLAKDADARRQLAVAEAAMRRAVAAADAAAAAKGFDLASEQAIAEAELTLRAANRVAVAAATSAAEAPRLHREAVGRAHRHAAFDAVERRISACADHAAALAAVAAAKAKFELASQDLRDFVSIGVPLGGAVNNMPRDIVSEAHERGIWRGHQVDIENRLFYPGERT